MKLFVLMRERIGSDGVSAHCVCSTMDDIEQVIESIANHRDNRKYPMRQGSARSWTIGPTEDEGFFGHKPMRFWVNEATVRGSLKDQLSAGYTAKEQR